MTGIDSRVQNIAAVDVEAVVFDAAAVYAELCASQGTDFSFVLATLIADTWCKRYKLREITAVQSQGRYFLLRNRP